MHTLRTALLVNAAFMVAACGEESQPTSEPATDEQVMGADLATLLADIRSEEDRERDAGRKPAEVIAAMGIEPGMTVLEIIAASGWYTEVLSIAVGSEGHVTAHNTAFALQMRDGANDKALSARLADGRRPNVSRLTKEMHEFSAEDGPFDAAFTALNLHDIYNRGGEEAAVAAVSAIYTTLKPGGFFVVIDHQGREGQDNVELHRMLKTDAIRVAQASGFIVETDSGVLHHHSDDMTMHMRDDSVRGKTNRFLLKLRKPE